MTLSKCSPHNLHLYTLIYEDDNYLKRVTIKCHSCPSTWTLYLEECDWGGNPEPRYGMDDETLIADILENGF